MGWKKFKPWKVVKPPEKEGETSDIEKSTDPEIGREIKQIGIVGAGRTYAHLYPDNINKAENVIVVDDLSDHSTFVRNLQKAGENQGVIIVKPPSLVRRSEDEINKEIFDRMFQKEQFSLITGRNARLLLDNGITSYAGFQNEIKLIETKQSRRTASIRRKILELEKKLFNGKKGAQKS